MYDQLKNCFARFNSEEAIKESMHKHETQINKSLNQEVSRSCPKFKLLGTSMTLKTRVNTVLCKRNNGYKQYYEQALKKLHINQKDCKQYHFDNGVVRQHETKLMHYRKIISKDYRRKRKHKIEAMKREQVLDSRIEKVQGTYGSGKAFENDSDAETGTKISKTSKKFCKWCDRYTNHSTWRSKQCVSHDDYKQWQLQTVSN